MNALSAHMLSVAVGDKKILERVNISIERGRITAICGPNGAGKSTLLKALCGIFRPSGGKVTLDGSDTASLSGRSMARAVAYVPQDFSDRIPFTVRETVLMGRAPWQGSTGRCGPDDTEAADRALADMGLQTLADRSMSRLSGGERQRACIVRALCQTARFILLDEPTSALDYGHSLHIMETLSGLRRKNIGVVMVTHDVNLSARYADILVMMKSGSVVAAGAPSEILTSELLEDVYRCRCMPDKNPWTNSLYITPIAPLP